MGSNLKIGLALGSGSSRGWSHIGIIKSLVDLGITPSIVCGTSAGALVGASYVSGNMDKLEEWAYSLTKFKAVKLLDIHASLNGFVNIERFNYFLNNNVASDDALIENFSKQYAAVATELGTGREVWLTKGSLIQAVWSSISLPGLFPAVRNNDKWLVDGGLVNPVPVSVCRALGADIVIAVNLNSDIIGLRHKTANNDVIKKDESVGGKLTDRVREYSRSLFSNVKTDHHQPPGLFDAIAGSINITQDRITRSRLAGNPPEIMLSPKLSYIGLLEIYRAREAIREGEKCVQKMKPEIISMLETMQ